MLPHFIIVGAMKSGTSTLAHYLRQHPQIYMPEEEIHFFDARSKYANRWQRGVQWYKNQFDDASRTDLVGEKTPTYSYLPSVPQRMHQVVPDVKLLWILRNPVDRAYSNYWHAVCAGDEWLSFEEAIRREDERVKQDVWKGYVLRSQYIEQIERFLNHFERDAMHFCLLENFKEDPGSVLGEVCTFLGVDGTKIDLQTIDRRKNATVPPHSVIARYVRGMFDDIPLAGSLIQQLESKFNRRKQPGYPEMSLKVRKRLGRHFTPYNRKLEETVGIDVGIWDD